MQYQDVTTVGFCEALGLPLELLCKASALQSVVSKQRRTEVYRAEKLMTPKT